MRPHCRARVIAITRLAVAAGLALRALAAGTCAAQAAPAPPASAETNVEAAYLQSVVDAMRVRVDGRDDGGFQPQPTALLKYSDPARGYAAAGVWRLGKEGRPRALVSLEYWLRGETDEPRLMFEFMSYTEAKLELESPLDGTAWQSEGAAPGIATLADGPQLAASRSARLRQLRELARRFTVSESHEGEFAALRLLPQPIDRYTDPAVGIREGAAFVFVYGTNPEAALLIECHEQGWYYSCARMSWAELVVELDGSEVARFPQLTSFPKGLYETSGHTIR